MDSYPEEVTIELIYENEQEFTWRTFRKANPFSMKSMYKDHASGRSAGKENGPACLCWGRLRIVYLKMYRLC